MRASLKAQKCQLSGNNTGLGAHFVDLADRMLKRNGNMAFVLPVTAITRRQLAQGTAVVGRRISRCSCHHYCT